MDRRPPRDILPSWEELAQRIQEGPKRDAFLAMERPVFVAAQAVDVLNQIRRGGAAAFTAREGAVGLLFAGVRALVLLGVDRKGIDRLVDAFWKLNATEGAGRDLPPMRLKPPGT